MVSFPEALELLLKQVPRPPAVRCRLEDAAGRILREPVVADRDFPAFDRVMMDGFALRFADWQDGHRKFQIAGTAPAGAPETTLDPSPGTCVEVMTGAPCPAGTDCIVPVEEVTASGGGWVEFGNAAAPEPGVFLHRAGSDAAAGAVLLEPGTVLGSREIGVAASCGAAWLEVSEIPKIAVIATGDELVAVDEIPAPHQIRQSNGHSLAAALQRAGFPASCCEVMRDGRSTALADLRQSLASHDWLILTGAVSMGARDFVPSILAEAGCRKIFHGIAQRPGKPGGFWTGPDGQMIVALPGNPVSALTGLHTLVIPALSASAGAERPAPRFVVMENRKMQLTDLTRHLPVTLRDDGRVDPAPTGNSGDFIGLLRSDGFITLPPLDAGPAPAAHLFTPWL